MWTNRGVWTPCPEPKSSEIDPLLYLGETRTQDVERRIEDNFIDIDGGIFRCTLRNGEACWTKYEKNDVNTSEWSMV